VCTRFARLISPPTGQTGHIKLGSHVHSTRLTHVHAHTHMHTHAHMYAHTHACMRAHTQTCARAHTRTYTHTHTHTHTPALSQFSTDLRDLTKALLSKNPKLRPSADALLKLPWLKVGAGLQPRLSFFTCLQKG